MNISVKRLERLLQAQNFELVDESGVERSAIFARRGQADSLYERVSFHCQGKRGEAVSACAEVSVIRGRNASKGLAEKRLVMELADVKELVDEHGFWLPGRGMAFVETMEKAKEWEQRFAEDAPREAAKLAIEKGPELLANTAHCRSAAAEVWKSLGEFHDLLGLRARLEQAATVEQRRQAQRLAEWPGVLQVKQAEMIYEIATTAVILNASKDSTLHVDVAADPLYDDNLMWLIQILVDRIISTARWQAGGCSSSSQRRWQVS